MGQRYILILTGARHAVVVLTAAEVRALCIAGATGLDGSAEAQRSAILTIFGGQSSLDAARRAVDFLAAVRQDLRDIPGRLR